MTALALLALLLAPAASPAATRHVHTAALDKPYRHLHHPRVSFLRTVDSLDHTKNDVLAVIGKQSSVKMQGARGTCSIFSATALLESMLQIAGKADAGVDLSEEWLEVLIAQHATDDGSDSVSNFTAIHTYGMAADDKLVYIPETWTKLADGNAKTRCDKLSGVRLAHCLTGHWDSALLGMEESSLSNKNPEFYSARVDALAFKKAYLSSKGAAQSGTIDETNEIKELLDRGIPVTLDIAFFYGAWNHRLAGDLDINRNMDNWEKGIVGYPEPGSNDLVNSWKKPAGHSVVIVGYDDNREVSYESKMQDGSMKRFTRKGVYYFKNSWGTGLFGTATEIDGKIVPGYGMITQDYANEKGQFFKLVL